MAPINIADAVAVTGATTGTVLALQSVGVGPLTAPQKTALVAFVTSLGLGIPSANIVDLNISRQRGAAGNIMCTITGLVIPATAAAAITNRGNYDDIVGIVP